MSIKPPTREMMSSVFSILEDYEIYLPEAHVEMTTAVVLHFLKNYDTGNEHLSELLKLNVSNARHDKDYIIRDKNTALTRKIKPANIKFLHGCIVEGEPFDLDEVVIKEKETTTCECCGTRTICSQDQEYNDSLICTYCLERRGELDAQDSIRVHCEECTYTGCSWNPANERVEIHYG
jgi:SUMO ligase MMS21 Smc5/6 complex component